MNKWMFKETNFRPDGTVFDSKFESEIDETTRALDGIFWPDGTRDFEKKILILRFVNSAFSFW